eukprot:1827342-Karenia_brevis.AAC.1
MESSDIVDHVSVLTPSGTTTPSSQPPKPSLAISHHGRLTVVVTIHAQHVGMAKLQTSLTYETQ